jgi:hypothetical protein
VRGLSDLGFMSYANMVFYNLILALWVGGITAVSLIVTPSIFRTFPKESAGEIVGAIFPGYFLFNFIVTLSALVIFLILFGWQGEGAIVSEIILVCSVVISMLHKFKIHPAIKKIKEEIKTLHAEETEAPESALKKQFGKMHFVSFALNFLLLCFGVTLIVLAPTI